MFVRGEGPGLVVIPGLQGRWEWMRPALMELSKHCRTVSYSLCGDIGSRMRRDPALGLENDTRQLERVMDRAGLDRAVVCGISYGGFVALHFAAAHPERVTKLILSNSPAPGWTPNAQQAGWLRRPWLSAPIFLLTAPTRVWPEMTAAFPNLRDRIAFGLRQGLRVLAAPMVPGLMASRINAVRDVDFYEDCRRITMPTLVLSGDAALDRVVPVANTRTYASLIAGARYVTMERTGHMGSLMQPELFAKLVADFVHADNH
jgi:pimeloyl-ACP methyl ester carboxylesterase